jgi:hypothetical protein
MSIPFPDKAPRGPRIKAGGVGEYYEGPLFTGRRTTVYASTCSHCAHIMEFESRRKMDVDVCRRCMRIVCPRCAGSPCETQEAYCDRVEREARIRHRIETWSWKCY